MLTNAQLQEELNKTAKRLMNTENRLAKAKDALAKVKADYAELESVALSAQTQIQKLKKKLKKKR